MARGLRHLYGVAVESDALHRLAALYADGTRDGSESAQADSPALVSHGTDTRRSALAAHQRTRARTPKGGARRAHRTARERPSPTGNFCQRSLPSQSLRAALATEPHAQTPA